MKKTILAIAASFLLITQAHATNPTHEIRKCQSTLEPVAAMAYEFISTETIEKDLKGELDRIHSDLVQTLKESTERSIKNGMIEIRDVQKSSISRTLFTMLRE
jgi:hypothetical protein